MNVFHQPAPDQVVLGDLPGGLGQRRHFRHAVVQANRRIVGHRPVGMLRKIRIAIGHRDSVYRLHDLIEMDDALIGGRRTGGKRGRGAGGKTLVLVAIENRDKRAGFIAMQQVSGVTRDKVAQFVKRHLPLGQWCVVMHCLRCWRSALRSWKSGGSAHFAKSAPRKFASFIFISRKNSGHA